MIRSLLRLRGPLAIGLLAALTLAIPAPAAPADQPQGADKKKEIQALEKQLADLQAKLAALKNGKVETIAAPTAKTVEGTIPDSVLKEFAWRCIGPANMGGRVTSIAVNEADPTTYYIATASGGLLKTANNGTTFDILFDKEATVSIGDVALAPSNPEIVWVGTGESNPRNSVTYGDGVYKSTNGGKTFTNMGLKKSFQIGKIVVHPKDPNTVYVGALGRLYGPNEERGVFKTTDGGKTWSKSLYLDDKTGCIDLRMDPQDPNTLIAAMWERKRDEHDGFYAGDKDAPPDQYGPIVTHGAGGGLFKSTDAGKTWKKLTDEKLKNGLPTVKTGRMGLDYSQKTKGLIFAIIDTEKVGTGTVSRVYLGTTGPEDQATEAKIADITEGGPADKAGLKAGDIITAIEGKKIASYAEFLDATQSKNPGDKLKLTVKRGDKDVTLELTLGTRPGEAKSGGGATGAGTTLPPITGVTFGRGDTLTVATVAEGGAAETAGIKPGDTVSAIEGKKIADVKEYAAALSDKKAGDKIKITVVRDMEEKTFDLTLAANPRKGGGGGGGGGQAGGQNTLPLPGFVPEFSGFGGGGGGESVKIATVTAGGPAEKAGIKVGDEVTAINGREVTNFRDFLSALRVGPRAEDPRKAGDVVKFTIKSGDKTREVELALVETPVQFGGGGGGRGVSSTRPYGMGLGGQQANIQARQGKDGYQTGGVYMSKDNGDTWTRVNSLNSRPMYFSVVRLDPNDDNTLYVLCDTPTPVYKSTDGGKTFASLQSARGVHADSHAFWINPKDSRHLIIGCDGGFYVSYDKGTRWDHLNTLALGQFYHVAVDSKKPYRVYGGLQDNGSWGGPSHTLRRYGPVNEDWVFVSGGDGFVCRVDPTDPDLVYAESQGGNINRRNFRTGESGSIRPRPVKEGEALRFNWNTPYILSSHNPSIFYCGAQYVFRSVKKGADLKAISPDLTRSKKGSMIALAESPRNPDILWAGTDDGNLWVTKDGGDNWTNVTAHLASAGAPGPRCIGTIEPSRDKDGRCYVVLDAHRSDDDKPYVCVTDDFGNSFKSLNNNLPQFGSTRCLREDYTNTNILYLGTEFGAWISANKGESWSKLGSGLPTVAVHEFAQPTTANEVVVATHGRSVWVLDVNAIRQMKPETLKEKVALFTPAPAVRWKLGVGGESPYSVTDRKFVGTNPARGAVIEYCLTEKADKVALKIVDVTGRTVWTAPTGRPGPGGPGGPGGGGRFGGGGGGGPAANTAEPPRALTDPGLHRVIWTMGGGGGGRGGGGGARQQVAGVQPGMYRVVLTVGNKEYTQPLTVEIDPNAPRDLITIGGDGDDVTTDEDKGATRIDD